ncbi:hypothetical protein [Sphingosinicella sp. CPCC 101087]|uniref:hypothetical protein n=1 Tax=Sphingosinicella sp. CPCC 101087 TaxID=2497754 RepID=UPI00101D104C|nr:hypothetical protein [Sphingosinicella sp. CPCC 101087]
MHKLLFVAAAAALAAPAAAQAPVTDPLEAEIVRSIPHPGEVEAMAPVLDRSVGALMELDVGPLIDAADPYGRRPGYGVPGRTLRELGRRDDPYFEERLRGSIYGATADVSRMMGAFAAAAPSLARSVRELERALGTAIDRYDRPEPYAYDDPQYDDPYYDDPYYPAD